MIRIACCVPHCREMIRVEQIQEGAPGWPCRKDLRVFRDSLDHREYKAMWEQLASPVHRVLKEIVAMQDQRAKQVQQEVLTFQALKGLKDRRERQDRQALLGRQKLLDRQAHRACKALQAAQEPQD